MMTADVKHHDDKNHDDKQLAALIADAEEAKTNPEGQAFIDWHNHVSDVIRQRKPFSGHLANAFNRSRQDTGSLAERYDAAIKVLRHVWAHDEMPKPEKAVAAKPVTVHETSHTTGHAPKHGAPEPVQE